MTILAFISVLSPIIVLLLGIYTLKLDIRSKLNRIFFTLCISLFIFALFYTFAFFSKDKNTILFYVNIASIGWCFYIVIYLHFVLVLTGRIGKMKRVIVYLLYIPAIIFFIKEQIGVLTVKDVFYSGYYWKEIPANNSPWYWGWFIMTGIYLSLATIYILSWMRKSDSKREKKQGLFILISILPASLFTTTTDVIFPFIGIYDFPSTFFIVILVFVSGLWVAVNRFKLMAVTPEFVMNTIINQMMDLLILLDKNNKIINVNKKVESLLQINNEKLLDKDIFHLVNENDILQREMKKIYENGMKSTTFEVHLETMNRELILVRISMEKILDRFGDVLGTVLTGSDIREEKKLEEEKIKRISIEKSLRENEKKFRQITENMADLVVQVDLKGIIEYISPSIKNILGYEKEDLLEKSILKIIHHEFREEFRSIFINGIQNRANIVGEGSLYKKNSEIIWIHCIGSFILDDDDNINSVILTARDVTEKKFFEEKLKKNEKRLQKRNEIIENDISNAQRIQLALLPEKKPEIDFLNIDFRYLPLEAIGGDYFSFTNLSEGGFGLFMGDVTGHGVSAALFLSMLKVTTDRVCRIHGQEPQEFISNLNSELLYNMPYTFITAVYAFFSHKKNKTVHASFANGGHPGPILLSSDKQRIETLSCKGTILGTFDDLVFDEKKVVLEEGDRLFFFTDGIVETRNDKGELFGFERFEKEIMKTSHLSIGESLDSILNNVNQFRGKVPIDDDIAIICVEVDFSRLNEE